MSTNVPFPATPIGYGNMEAYQMGTLIAFGGANILIAFYDYFSWEQPTDAVPVCVCVCVCVC